MDIEDKKQNIPQGWRLTTLGKVSSITNGSTNTQDAVVDGEYPLFDRSVEIKKSNKYLFDDTAIILPGEGAEFIPKIYNGKFDLHQRAYAIFPDKNIVNPEYLYHFLYANRKDFAQKSVGSTVRSLRLPLIQSIDVNVPSIKEQQKIAEILGTVDEDIEKTEEIIKSTEKLKQGLMQQLFTRGIGHTKFKETKIGQIPEKWNIKTFEEFAVLQRGFDLPVPDRTIGQYDLVTSNGVTDTHDKFKVKAPGVVTGRSGTLGNVFYIENNFWPLNTTLYIKDFHGNHEKFVYYKIQSFDVARFGTGTGVPTLNRNIVHKEVIAVPEYVEQKKIAEILSIVDEKILVNKKLKEKLTLLKKGLMQDLLSGKVRVNN